MKKKCRHLLNGMPMQKKLLLSYSFVVIIPICVSLFLMRAMSSIVMGNATEDAYNSIERVDIKISQIMDTIYSQSYDIAYNANLTQALSKKHAYEYERVTSTWEYSRFTDIMKENSIEDLIYYVDSLPVLNNGYIMNPSTQIRKSSWYQYFTDTSALSFWSYIESPRFLLKQQKSLAFIRPVYKQGALFGVLNIYVNQSRLQEILALENYPTMLLTPEHTIVASSDKGLLGKNLSDAALQYKDGKVLLTDQYNDSKATVLSHAFTPSGSLEPFLIVSILPTDKILKAASAASRTSSTMVIIGIILSFTFLIILSKLLTYRLSNLKTEIHRVANGDFSYHPISDSNDEIGQLSKDFSSMVENIRDLIDKVYIAEIQKQKLETHQKDIKLQVLSSQINPHFLFNALESIRMKAVTNHEPEIAEPIRMLSQLLRKSLYAGNHPVPLSEELDIATSYLELQKFRFHDQFDYHIQMMPDSASILLPPFTLQPIVENSFRHAFENMDYQHRGNFISIMIHLEQDILFIRIADNGKGMDSTTLLNLQHRLEDNTLEPSAEHVGILNVHQRIQLIYGKEYGLSITSEIYKGTIVTICLPV